MGIYLWNLGGSTSPCNHHQRYCDCDKQIWRRAVCRWATVTLFNRTEQIDQVASDDKGAFSITVPGDQLLDVYFLTTKDTYVDTYMQFFSFLEDRDEFEAPILPAQETQDVIASVAEGDHPVDETKGIIAGA